MKFILGLFSLLSIIIVVSCNNDNEPKSLKELHSTFTKEELKPETKVFDKDHITFVATGHLYPLLHFPKFYDSLVSTIEKQNPDYVFFLGDIVFNDSQEEWDKVLKHTASIKDKLYFAPGNHDLNYHYERYVGDKTHQNEAELRYLSNVGYRYKLIKDNFANYLFINMNDSIDRIAEYVEKIKPEINASNPTFILSSQAVWHKGQQDPNDVSTWPLKPFDKEEILSVVNFADYLVHGDWNKKFYRSTFWSKPNGLFQVMSVGNKRRGDSLYISRFYIYKDTVITKPIFIPIPDSCKWYKQKTNK